MKLNSIQPGFGARTNAHRVGRGVGSGWGKTCGRGHKGQHSRSGGFHKTGFEGGQMPIQRRLPKFGFRSRKKLVRAEINLSELNKLSAERIDLAVLKEAGLVAHYVKAAKVVLSGKIERAITLVLPASKGARDAIESAGGQVSWHALSPNNEA